MGLLLLTFGCGAFEPLPSEPERLGSRHLLMDAGDFAVLPGVPVQLAFDRDQVSFNAGCASHVGSYEIDEQSRLLVSELTSSQDTCHEEVERQDARFVEFMTSSPELQFIGERVRLVDDASFMEFVDFDSSTFDRPLRRTVWALVHPSGDDARSTLFFDQDELMVDALCVEGGGHFTTAENLLLISDLVYDALACDAPDRDADANVQQVLVNGRVEFEIVGPTLTLRRGNVVLEATALDD